MQNQQLLHSEAFIIRIYNRKLGYFPWNTNYIKPRVNYSQKEKKNYTKILYCFTGMVDRRVRQRNVTVWLCLKVCSIDQQEKTS